MTWLLRDGGRLPRHGFALALGIWFVSGPSAAAGGEPGVARHHHAGPCGTPGCGGHGHGAGFQGFGLGFHLGHGYGGKALGVGPGGGYPFYGGPGYPHAEPQLRRLKKIVPFAYYGGPGHPTACQPNFYGGVGSLVVDRPVVTLENDPGGFGDYGPFSGAMPYPDTAFGPFPSSEAAAPVGTTDGARPPYPPAPPASIPPAGGADPAAASVPRATHEVKRVSARGATAPSRGGTTSR